MRGVVLATAVVASGCNSLGEGSLALRLGAEGAAMTGIPAEDFVDGWSVTFDRYLVSVADVEIATADGDSVHADGPYMVDLHVEEPEVDLLARLAGRRWDHVSFSMLGPDFVYWIEGRGSHPDGRTVTFAWGLDNPTRNTDCTDGTDGKPGVVVRANTTTEGEITFHIEHMFWDRLGSEQTMQRFEAIAAMADDAGHVTWDALAMQPLADLRDADGQPLLDESDAPLFYDPGSTAATNLQQFILAATSTQAHWNGEGLCTVNVL